jgi:teichoic acid transport system permease protein
MSNHADSAGLRPIDNTVSTRVYFRGVWERRDFVFAMPAESMRAKHQTTVLGNVWHLGNPLLTIGVYLIVFGALLGADRGVDNYLLWLTVGVFAYRLTQGSVLGGAMSIASNIGLMRAIRFPRAVLPISVVIGELLTYAFEMSAVLAVAVMTGEGISRRILMLPLIVLVHTMLNLGGAFGAARLNDSFRDMQQLIPFVFRLLQFLSGVMYPIELYLDTDHAWLHRLIVWNPLVGILEMYRWVFLATPVDGWIVGRSIIVSAVLLILGFRFFVGAEQRYGRP